MENSLTEKIVLLLQELVQINTEQVLQINMADNKQGVVIALHKVLKLCDDLGFHTKNINNRVGWAEIGEGEELIGIPIHLDVVPAGTGWTYPPYSGTIVDNVIYGRGVVDNKVSVAIMIYLLDELHKENNLHKRIRLIFGTDEETGMSDMRHYLDVGEEVPDFGLVPDAMYPVVNGEKAKLHIRMKKKHSYINYIKIDGGTQENVVPSEAKAQIPSYLIDMIYVNEWKDNLCEDKNYYDLSFQGISAHGSTPEKGQNALFKLILSLSQIKGYYDNKIDVQKIDYYLCRDYHGQNMELCQEDDIFGKTTINFGKYTACANESVIDLDIRFGFHQTKEEIVQRLVNIFSDWEVDVVHYKPRHYITKDHPVVKALLSAYEIEMQKDGYMIAMSGGTYASLFPNMVAFGPKFMETKTGAHGIDEHMSISDIEMNIRIYRKALSNLLLINGKW